MEFPQLGFIGVGAMGRPMVRNLLQAGYAVLAFDLKDENLQAVKELGATATKDLAELVRTAQVVMTSLPSSEAFINTAKQTLIPGARDGQIFIEFGTTTPPEMRRMAKAFADKGAHCLDVPVSGGPGAMDQKNLRMFAGGDEGIFRECLPLLKSIGGDKHIHYCGPAGNGQIVKGVNQLMMGLVVAAHTEAVAFGVRAGVDAELLKKAVGGEGWLRGDFARVAQSIAKGEGNCLGVKFRELPYCLREAHDAGLPLPVTEAVYNFCDKGERLVIDDNRPAPSFFHELTRKRSGDR